MNLLQLQYFKHLAESEHLLKAANKLHVSASTISVSLKHLEEELGTPLFNRIGRNMELNEHGKIFLTYVNKVFVTLEEAKETIAHSVYRREHTVRFSINAARYYSDLFIGFMKEYPDITVKYISCEPDENGDILTENDLDFMITSKRLRGNPNLIFQEVTNSPYILAVSKEHPLAKKYVCQFSDLKDEVFLNCPEENHFQGVIDNILEKHGFNPKKTIEVGVDIRLRMIKQGAGVGFMTQMGVENEVESGLVPVFVKELDGMGFQVYAYWQKDKPLSEISRFFLDKMHVMAEEKQAKSRKNSRYQIDCR